MDNITQFLEVCENSEDAMKMTEPILTSLIDDAVNKKITPDEFKYLYQVKDKGEVGKDLVESIIKKVRYATQRPPSIAITEIHENLTARNITIEEAKVDVNAVFMFLKSEEQEDSKRTIISLLERADDTLNTIATLEELKKKL
jgi:hypothetical protein